MILSLAAFLLIAATPTPHGGRAIQQCSNLAGAKHCKPDLTAGPTISVGGRVVPWGGTVTLRDTGAIPALKPYCYFNISYVLKNVGLGNAGPPDTPAFKNVIYLDLGVWVISRQSLLSLAASTNWTLHPAVNLVSGDHALFLQIDADNNVAESNELNNRFFITYHLIGNCKDLTNPPVTF
jgi:hypothetical protein